MSGPLKVSLQATAPPALPTGRTFPNLSALDRSFARYILPSVHEARALARAAEPRDVRDLWPHVPHRTRSQANHISPPASRRVGLVLCLPKPGRRLAISSNREGSGSIGLSRGFWRGRGASAVAKEVNHITGPARPNPRTGMRAATSLRRGVPTSAAPHNVMCPENGDTGADSEPGGRKRHTRKNMGA